MDFRRLMREERQRALERERTALQEDSSSRSSEKDAGGAAIADAVTADAAAALPDAKAEEPLCVWLPRVSQDLERFRVNGIRSVFCVDDWISVEEEAAILERVHGVAPAAWVQLRNRRLQMYGGEVKTPFQPEPLPLWLQQIASSLVDNRIFATEQLPNHVLINEYGLGDGIMPHQDGPSYYPLVAIVSTGADARVNFVPHRQWASDTTLRDVSFTLKRRSLLLFTEDAYTKCLHSIDDVQHDKRVSLTIRHVNLHTSQP